MDEISEAQAVLKEVDERLRGKPNIIGTGVGYKNNDPEQDDIAIIANCVKKQPKGFGRDSVGIFGRVAKSYDGIMTDVLETGAIRALDPDATMKWTTPAERQKEHRPAPGGVSIGHKSISAGTLGCLVKNVKTPADEDDQVLILSNNHVLANSNDAKLKDPIYQPGPHDGGNSSSKIAELYDYEHIFFEGEDSNCEISNAIVRSPFNFFAKLVGSQTRVHLYRTQGVDNLVDAAIALPVDNKLVSEDILDIGRIQGWTEANLGDEVQKSGRTTSLTRGIISQVSVTTSVSYGPARMALFKDQIMITGSKPFSQGGDSGSVIIVIQDGIIKICGLLFAGSDTVTIANRVEHVFSALGVTV